MTNDQLLKELKKLMSERQKPGKDGKQCPTCGHCPTCGQHRPYWTGPWYPYSPYWITTTPSDDFKITWTANTTSGDYTVTNPPFAKIEVVG